MDAANRQHSSKASSRFHEKCETFLEDRPICEEPRLSKSADFQDNKGSINGVFNVEEC